VSTTATITIIAKVTEGFAATLLAVVKAIAVAAKWTIIKKVAVITIITTVMASLV